MHQTVPVQVTVDVDEGIADAVKFLAAIPGVRTFASCQGTFGDGGSEPYGPMVLAYWPDKAEKLILKRFTIGQRNEGSGYLHPIAGASMAFEDGDFDECEGCSDLSDNLVEDEGGMLLCEICAALPDD